MTNPKLTKTSVAFGYTSDDQYRMAFTAKGGKGTQQVASLQEVPPEEALLAAFQEMARVLIIFGFHDKALEQLNAVRKRCSLTKHLPPI